MSTPVPLTMYVTYSLDGGGAERLLTNITLQQSTPDLHAHDLAEAS
jgi:hypothetical protein